MCVGSLCTEEFSSLGLSAAVQGIPNLLSLENLGSPSLLRSSFQLSPGAVLRLGVCFWCVAVGNPEQELCWELSTSSSVLSSPRPQVMLLQFSFMWEEHCKLLVLRTKC